MATPAPSPKSADRLTSSDRRIRFDSVSHQSLCGWLGVSIDAAAGQQWEQAQPKFDFSVLGDFGLRI